jgi:tRNA(Arg) A34 adenosine deaminase TadA
VGDKLETRFMRLAIKEAQRNICQEMAGGPFGACIVKNGKVLARARNTVLKKDATCHAEINAIRIASRKTKNYDLSGSIIYSTTEPCPMCFSAIHWARIKAVVYGTTVRQAKKIGFHELAISNAQMKATGKSKVKIFPDFCFAECLKLLQDWGKAPGRQVY